MTALLLTERHLESLCLKGGCTGSSESMQVKMPHCWQTHVVAHMMIDPYILCSLGNKPIILYEAPYSAHLVANPESYNIYIVLTW